MKCIQSLKARFSLSITKRSSAMRPFRISSLSLGKSSSTSLFRNDTPRTGRHWLGIECIGRKANRSAIGARVTVRAGGLTQTREVKSGSGYLSQSDLRLVIGLGAAVRIDSLSVRWPGGAAESFPADVPVDAYIRIVEGTGR